MELLSSTCRVTLTGVLLLDFGDLLEAPEEIVPSRHVEVVPPLRSEFSKRIPRGNASFTLSFVRCKQFATEALAQSAKMLALSTAPTGAGACLIEYLGAAENWNLDNACLSQGGMRAVVEKGSILKLKYEIQGGQLSPVAIP